MSLTVAPYSPEHVAAVKEFNRRLRDGGAPEDYFFSETSVSHWLPTGLGNSVENELFVALESGAVRGAYALRRQKFSFHGQRRTLDFFHHPVAEGILDKKYAQVGPFILMHILRNNPLTFALGMGGYDRPLPRMLQALKWNLCLISFHFRVNHPARFLRHMRRFHKTRAMHSVAELAAFTGAGWLGLKTLHGLRSVAGLRQRVKPTVVDEFDDWADQVWDQNSSAYAMVGVRDLRSLRILYPRSNRSFIRLKFDCDGKTIGWAVVANTQNFNHSEYGDLRVGTILDGLSRPEHSKFVIAGATQALLDRDVDLITTNQSHTSWQHALRQCGFLQGPSNFVFAASAQLSEMLQPFEESVARSHINRGDGDSLLQYL